MSEDGIDIPLLDDDFERSLRYVDGDPFELTQSETERKNLRPTRITELRMTVPSRPPRAKHRCRVRYLHLLGT